MSKGNNSKHMRAWGNGGPLAATAEPGEVNAEAEAIEAYLRSEGRERSPMEREALFQLAMTPFEASTIRQACTRIAAILDVLRDGPSREIAINAYQHALDQAHQRAAGQS